MPLCFAGLTSVGISNLAIASLTLMLFEGRQSVGK